MIKTKVSIIIPVFNRKFLIQETLQSILEQTYEDWECIVVDDMSTDGTQSYIEQYAERHARIKYFQRPGDRSKGANSCRNFGFEKSSGEYIIWFDSDDLMTPNHLEEKVRFIMKTGCDFVVARTRNFDQTGMLEPYIYNKKPYGIKAIDFILLQIHWYTYDILLKRDLAEKIQWNEEMKSWQDYNYFCKMLLESEDGAYIDKVLTHRRIHAISIQKSLTRDAETFVSELLENRILTYNDIEEQIDFGTKKELIYGMMNLSFELMRLKYLSEEIYKVLKIVFENLGLRSSLYFLLALQVSFTCKKGHFLLERAKRRGRITFY